MSGIASINSATLQQVEHPQLLPDGLPKPKIKGDASGDYATRVPDPGPEAAAPVTPREGGIDLIV